MDEISKIVVKRSNYPIVRFFLWVALVSFAMFFIGLWRSKFVLAAVGFALLLIGRGAGDYFQSKGLGSRHGLRCRKCGQLVDLQQALRAAPPADRAARCPHCGEPFGRFSNGPKSPTSR